MKGNENKNRIVIAFIIIGFGSLVHSSIMQQQASAVTPAEIQQKYLKNAHDALENGNTTGAVREILSILDWEFSEVYPRMESFFGNVTASG